jgi:nitroreductase
MELTDALRTTGAVRTFTDDPLPDDVLARILDAARFAPNGGNRQGTRILVLRERGPRQAIADLCTEPVRRYVAQREAGESPWNPVDPPGVDPEVIASTRVPGHFTRPLVEAPVLLVLCVDLRTVAAMDQDLDRIGLVAGGSVYPLAWSILLAAHAEGFGGTFSTMAVAAEPAVIDLLGIPADHAVACFLPLGRPVHRPTKLSRLPVSELARRERWDGPPLVPGD